MLKKLEETVRCHGLAASRISAIDFCLSSFRSHLDTTNRRLQN
jgi:hypothetical protein